MKTNALSGHYSSIVMREIRLKRSHTSVSNDDTSDYGQDIEINITSKKPTSKKSPVVLPYIKGVS